MVPHLMRVASPKPSPGLRVDCVDIPECVSLLLGRTEGAGVAASDIREERVNETFPKGKVATSTTKHKPLSVGSCLD